MKRVLLVLLLVLLLPTLGFSQSSQPSPGLTGNNPIARQGPGFIVWSIGGSKTTESIQLGTQILLPPTELSRFSIWLQNAPGTGNSYTFTVRINGSNTAFSCTISNTSDFCSVSDSLTTVSDSLVSIRFTTVGNPTLTTVTFRLESASGEGPPGPPGPPAPNNGELDPAGGCLVWTVGGSAPGESIEDGTQVTVPAGTLNSFGIELSAAPGVGSSYVFTVRVNASDTSITCSIVDNAMSCTDLLNSAAVSSLDLLSICYTTTGTPATSTGTWFINDSPSGGGGGGTVTGSGTPRHLTRWDQDGTGIEDTRITEEDMFTDGTEAALRVPHKTFIIGEVPFHCLGGGEIGRICFMGDVTSTQDPVLQGMTDSTDSFKIFGGGQLNAGASAAVGPLGVLTVAIPKGYINDVALDVVVQDSTSLPNVTMHVEFDPFANASPYQVFIVLGTDGDGVLDPTQNTAGLIAAYINAHFDPYLAATTGDPDVVLFSAETQTMSGGAHIDHSLVLCSGDRNRQNDNPCITITGPLGSVGSTTPYIQLPKTVIGPSVAELTDAASLTPDCTNTTMSIVLTLSQTSQFENPTGSCMDGQKMILRVKSASSQTITFGTMYRAGATIALPGSTSGGGLTDYFTFLYNATDNTLDYIDQKLGF